MSMNRKTSIELSKDGKSSMYILTKIDSEGFHHSIFVSKDELVEISKLINDVTIGNRSFYQKQHDRTANNS